MLDTTTYEVEVKAGQATQKIISNREPTGTFTITKYNSDKSATIQGVKYHVWSSDTGYDQRHTTSSNGKIEITNLKLRAIFLSRGVHSRRVLIR